MNKIIDSTVYGKNYAGIKCIGGNKIFATEIGRAVYSDKNLDGQLITFTVEPV